MYLCLGSIDIVHGLGVARGRTQPQLGGSYIHGVPIAPGNVRVVVDAILMEIELSYPTKELRTTTHAVGSYIQWPQVLLLPFSKASISPHSKASSQSNIFGRSRKKKEKLTLPGLLRTIYHIARAKKSGKQLYSFDLPHSLLGYEMTLIIDVYDVLQFYTLTQTSANCITAYMR